MVLPDGCVKCGVPTPGGARTRKKLFYTPAWIWVTLLIGVVPLLVLYYVLRKPIEVSYCVCEKCTSRMGLKKGIAVAAWVLFLAAVAVGVYTGATPALVAMVVLFIAAVVATVLVSAPLRVTGYDERYFSVGGACSEFVSALGETAR